MCWSSQRSDKSVRHAGPSSSGNVMVTNGLISNVPDPVLRMCRVNNFFFLSFLTDHQRSFTPFELLFFFSYFFVIFFPNINVNFALVRFVFDKRIRFEYTPTANRRRGRSCLYKTLMTRCRVIWTWIDLDVCTTYRIFSRVN